MTSIKEALTQGIETLSRARIERPRLDAEVLLAHVLQADRSRLYAYPEQPLSAAELARFQDLLNRRTRHEPVAYLTGEREFYGLPFWVTPQVLIPRPETELLVELALETIRPGHRVLDIGTGSGCIAVSVAVHAPQTTLIATDISAGALAIARRNAHRHNVDRQITFVQANLASGINAPIDLLISNPPYISAPEMETLAPNVKDFEPAPALTDGTSAGLSLVEKILAYAATHIVSGGSLLVEIGASQGKQVISLAQRAAPSAKFEIKHDLAGRDRILRGRF